MPPHWPTATSQVRLACRLHFRRTMFLGLLLGTAVGLMLAARRRRSASIATVPPAADAALIIAGYVQLILTDAALQRVPLKPRTQAMLERILATTGQLQRALAACADEVAAKPPDGNRHGRLWGRSPTVK